MGSAKLFYQLKKTHPVATYTKPGMIAGF